MAASRTLKAPWWHQSGVYLYIFAKSGPIYIKPEWSAVHFAQIILYFVSPKLRTCACLSFSPSVRCRAACRHCRCSHLASRLLVGCVTFYVDMAHGAGKAWNFVNNIKIRLTRNVGQCPTWWSPLFNAGKFGWRPLLECCAVTLQKRETRWN